MKEEVCKNYNAINKIHEKWIKYINTIFEFFNWKTDEEIEKLIDKIREKDKVIWKMIFWVNPENQFIKIWMREYSIRWKEVLCIHGIDQEDYQGSYFLESIYETIQELLKENNIWEDSEIKDKVDGIL